MEKDSKTKNTMRIAAAGIASQVVTALLGMVTRRMVVLLLGNEYVGLGSLFENIITMLSLAQLGIGSAIIVNLYRPLREDDRPRVMRMVRLYRDMYRYIALAVTVVGIVAGIFLQYLIKDTASLSFDMGFIRSVYFVSLAETVSSYLFAYRTTIIDAAQHKDVLLVIRSIIGIANALTRVVVLWLTHDYIMYAAVGLVFNILANIVCSYKATKMFPYIRDLSGSRMDKEERRVVLRDAKNLSVHALSGFVVSSTDSLIISRVLGLRTLGLVSNYNIIINTIKLFLSQIVEAVQAPLGHLVAEDDRDKAYGVISMMTYIMFLIGTFSSISLWVLSHDFVSIWLGPDHLVHDGTIEVLVVVVWVWTLTRPLWKISGLSGLYGPDIKNAVAEMITNIVVSIGLVLWIGLPGVYIGTGISTIFAFFLKSRLQFTRYFKRSRLPYYGRMLLYLLLAVGELGATFFVCRYITFESIWLSFILKCCVCVLLPNAVNLALFWRRPEGIYCRETAAAILHLKKKV